MFVYVFYNIFFLYVIITKHDVFVFLREIDFRFFFSQKHALTSWFPRIMRKCWRPVARIFGQMNARHTEDRLDWNRNKWTWWKLFLKGTKKKKRKKVDVLLPSNYLIEVVSTTMYIDYVLTSASGIPANIFFHI